MNKSQKSKYYEAWKAAYEPRVIETQIAPVAIRPVSLQALLMNGRIPITEFRRMQAAQEAAGVGPDGNTPLEVAVEFNKLINTVVIAAVVDPPVSQTGDPDNGILCVDDILFEDRLMIFNEANTAFDRMRPFPGKEVEPADGS